MADSIFTKIIRGEIPSTKVFEDESTYAFLDHNPKVPGHTLIVPKTQVEFVWDLSEADYQALMSTANKVAHRIKEVLQPKYVGMQVEGTAVPHAHVHVFPFNTREEYLHDPDAGNYLQESELTDLGKKLAF